MRRNGVLRPSAEKGFTLVELMIVVAIIGILAAAAIPQYSNYVVKSRMATVLHSISSVKTAISVCAQEGNGSFDVCESGKHNVPPTFAVKEFASVEVSKGEVTVTLTNGIGEGLDGGVITIKPVPNDAHIAWTTTYTGIQNKAAQEYLEKHN